VVLDGLVISILSILAGLYYGLVRGGLVRNLGLARLHWPGLLVVGIGGPVLVDRLDPPRSVWLIVLAFGALLVFTTRNRHLPGMLLVAAGVAANLLVVLVNGGMPVRADALVSAGLASRADVEFVEISGVQRLEEPGDQLVFLADVIPFEPTGQVLSPGDLLLLAGLAQVATSLLLQRTRRTEEPETETATPAAVEPAPAPSRPARTVRERPARTAKPVRERHIPDFEPIVVDDALIERLLEDAVVSRRS
jgi:hypothetical protein